MLNTFENILKKLGNFDRFLSYQVDLFNLSSLQTFPSYTLLKIWNNLPLELKQSTSITMFKNKIMKTPYTTNSSPPPPSHFSTLSISLPRVPFIPLPAPPLFISPKPFYIKIVCLIHMLGIGGWSICNCMSNYMWCTNTV